MRATNDEGDGPWSPSGIARTAHPGTPAARAGADRTVAPGAAVTLDGSGSTDPEGETLSYAWMQRSGDDVALFEAASARARFTAPPAPGALVFRLTVADPGGLRATDEVTVRVRDDAPRFAREVAPVVVALGTALAPVVLPEARGGNGALAYTLGSQPAGLAGLEFDPATRTLSGTPDSAGRYLFTYRAEDADAHRGDSDAGVLSFAVTVEAGVGAERTRRAVRGALSVLARHSLASALDSIGGRFDDAGAGAGVTLAGRTIALGAGGVAGEASPQRGEGCGVGRHAFGAGARRCRSAAAGASVGAGELMRAGAFTVALGEAGARGGGARWALWGRGDVGAFTERPAPATRYSGELRTGWLGVDARAGAWVAGVALSHASGEARYRDGAGAEAGGRVETELAALYPYGRWRIGEGVELRAVLGAGSGEVRHAPDARGVRETSALGMQMASVGLRRGWRGEAGMAFGARADASVARLATEAGAGVLDGLSAHAWRGRLGVEASRRHALGAAAVLTPFVEGAVRRDGGEGLAGTGLEVAGGLRYRAHRVRLEARARVLAAHTEEGVRERGVSVSARLAPAASGRGLSLSLVPRWGAATGGGARALWGERMPRGGGFDDAGAVDARIGYGVAVARRAVLTPYAETALAGDASRRFTLGTRFEAERVGVELAGTLRERGAASPEHGVRLDLELRF